MDEYNFTIFLVNNCDFNKCFPFVIIFNDGNSKQIILCYCILIVRSKIQLELVLCRHQSFLNVLLNLNYFSDKFTD